MTESFAPHTKNPCMSPGEVAEVAVRHQIPPAVLIACLGTESAFDPEQLVRYEPAYEKWLRRRIVIKASEYRPRATSWGVGHVMGQTLREMGFTGKFEELLIDHKQAAEWSARFLRRCFIRARALPLWHEQLDAENKLSIEKNGRPICLPKGVLDLWEGAVCAYNTGGFLTFPEKHILRFRWWRDRAHAFGYTEGEVV